MRRTYSSADADDAYRAYGDACELALYADAHARGVRRADPRAHAHVDDVHHEYERANEGSHRDRGYVRGAPNVKPHPKTHQCTGNTEREGNGLAECKNSCGRAKKRGRSKNKRSFEPIQDDARL